MKMVNTLKRLISIFAIFATSLPVLSYSATQSSYPTKGTPVAGDKALITDSADGNKTKQATVGSLPISTATQTALDGKETKAVVQASAPADTTVDWYDTDQESGVLVLKRHNGTAWVRASSHGIQYASNCAGITAGMCVDTDDGKLYYHNNTSVVEVGVDIDLSNYLSKTNTTAFSPTGDYHPATKKYVDDAVTAGGGYTDEQAQDSVGGMLSGNTETGITVTYNDATGKVDFVVATQSDVNFTSALNTKLTGIAAGAEVNVNADWNASSGDAQILNKPTIPTISDTAYGSSWNGDLGAASKNAIYDKIETIAGGSMTWPSVAGIPYWTSGTSWAGAYTVGTGANNIVQLNSSAQLPAVSAALLTNFPTLNQSTTGTAGGLSGTPDITVGALIASSISTTSTAAASAVFEESEANGGTYAVTLTVGDLSANKTVYGEHILQTTDVVDTPTDGSSAPASSNSLFDGLALKSDTTHNHTGVYEPADSNLIKSAEIDTSEELRGVLTDEVGTGAAYFVGGALGTPASAILTNATGLPAAGLALEPTAISSTRTLSSLNGYYTITGEYTVTLPARSAGAWGCFQTVGANVATIDVNASDNIMLDGTALADGTAIVSDGTTGKTICIQSRGADGWITWGNNGWASE